MSDAQTEAKTTTRYNEGKNKLELIPWEWVTELGQIFTFGAKKYAPNNWKLSLGTKDHDQVVEDRLGSALRHIYAWRRGEKLDPESGKHHLAMAAWNLLFIFWYDVNDTRNTTQS